MISNSNSLQTYRACFEESSKPFSRGWRSDVCSPRELAVHGLNENSFSKTTFNLHLEYLNVHRYVMQCCHPFLKASENSLGTSYSHTWGLLLHSDRHDLIVFGYYRKALKYIHWVERGPTKGKLKNTLERGPPNKGLASKMRPSELTKAPLSSAMKWIATIRAWNQTTDIGIEVGMQKTHASR